MAEPMVCPLGKVKPEPGSKTQKVKWEGRNYDPGNSTGVGIGCVSWDGTVYPDQFWRNQPVGNVRERPFSAIWSDPAQPLLARLREKKRHVLGRCALCKYLDVCGGNCRARAEAATANPWAADPACYLSDLEIGIEDRE